MNKNSNHDAPLFNKTEAGNSDKLALEKVRQEGRRFNKLIDIGTKTIRLVVAFAVLLIIADGVFQRLELDNSLIKDSFSLVK